MEIKKDTVVSLAYEISNLEGEVVEKTEKPISYLHGGYDGIFPLVEEALHGQKSGYACQLKLEPDDAFGEYDSDLVRVEPRALFPDDIQIGMQFEGGAEDSDDMSLYTITDIADGKVVVDGNHPFAGQVLVFSCTVEDVRPATREELAHGHVHGGDGHDH
ncbi:MAG: FKBP-type peptidyl-prolyl cis-trans isomerase [Burkholderiales bacterium]|nr:peptidylprolyl isomerase [Burkholderiales bacterium]MDQ3196386.1 peptidylprolyl isomerase [Pseudomonadota bacterium]